MFEIHYASCDSPKHEIVFEALVVLYASGPSLYTLFMFSPDVFMSKSKGGVCNGVCGAVPGHICPISPESPHLHPASWGR